MSTSRINELAKNFRSLYNFKDLAWENQLRGSQLVSGLIDDAEIHFELITNNEPSENHPAIFITASNKAPGKFRIAVNLDQLKVTNHLENDASIKQKSIELKELENKILNQPKPKIELQPIVDLLNEVHLPSKGKNKWEISNGEIVYEGPGITYFPKKLGLEVKEQLYEDFSPQAKEKGFSPLIIGKFQRALQAELHKNYCTYFFPKDTNFLYDLYKLTNAYKDQEKVKSKMLEAAATEVFKDRLPKDVSHHISGFLTPKKNGAALVKVTKGAHDAAKKAKKEAEEEVEKKRKP